MVANYFDIVCLAISKGYAQFINIHRGTGLYVCVWVCVCVCCVCVHVRARVRVPAYVCR
jgi:hypothetical protein